MACAGLKYFRSLVTFVAFVSKISLFDKIEGSIRSPINQEEK
jgi:hypothetical protein